MNHADAQAAAQPDGGSHGAFTWGVLDALHRIDGGQALEQYSASTKASTDGVLIYALRDLGMVCARAWLIQHFHKLGNECSVDIARDHLDDLRLPAQRSLNISSRLAGLVPQAPEVPKALPGA